jgi:serine/threonine protein kinase/WD40 repeat protein
MNEEEIFQAASGLSAQERTMFLLTACDGQPTVRARVERLLESHDNSAFMQRAADRPAAAEMAAEFVRLIPEGCGERIGNYTLLEQIGEGGCGVVYMAQQEEPVRRAVALKVIKLGMDTRSVIARFEQERQALALMDHPNIAKVLEAGATPSGRPFFVMELVHGIRITEFCQQNNLSITDRLNLFITVCQAIQHAHQKGIIHRDIKPSNILVALDDGMFVPKVIDFGIAKATSGESLTDKTLFTAVEQFIGTPAYMSPEQAEMSGLDIDTRSDIYSLGVLLYELLTGSTPFAAEELANSGIDEMRRIIREEDALRPSTRLKVKSDDITLRSTKSAIANPKSRIDPDLDWIVMKCLEKDRSRRYDTVNGLAADLKRHLNNGPILARPPSTAYRFQKAFRKNRLAFAAGGAVGLAMLLALIVLTVSIARITKEKNLKDAALQEKGAALIQAQDSAAAAKEQLFLALLHQARASRFSGQMGQRFGSLQALTEAAHIRFDERLRDEAIAAMALPDIRPGPAWPIAVVSWTDQSYRFSANVDAQGIISVRNVPGGQQVGRIESGHQAQLLLFSGDARFLAQLDEAKTLRVWRVEDAKSILKDMPELCSNVVFSQDGRHLCVGQEDRILRFNLTTGHEDNRWQAAGRVHSLAFHPDNHQLLVGYEEPAITSIYEATDGRRLADLPVASIEQQVVAWHPDGRRIAVAGDDARIQIWDVSAKRRLATLQGQLQRVTNLSFHPDGELLASQGWEGVCRLWNPSTGLQLLQVPRNFVPFAFSKDGRWLGGVGHGDGGQLVEVAAGPEYRTVVNSLGAGGGQHFDGDISPDGGILALAMDDGVRLWDLSNGLELAFLPIGRTISAIFQPDGGELLTSGPSGLHRWPFLYAGGGPSNGFRLGPRLEIPVPFIPSRIERSRDGRTLAVVSEVAGGAFLIDLRTGSAQGPFKPHQGAGFVALSPDGHWLATSGWHSHKALLWNVESGKMVRDWTGKSQLRISFTPDSRTLIISAKDEFTFWDVESFHEVRPSLPSEVALLNPAVFSPDGKLMAMVLSPGIIHLQETATSRTVAKLEDPHGDRTTWMKFTPDGATLVAASNYAQEIHVWDLRAIRVRLKQMGLDWDWPEFPGDANPPTRYGSTELRLKIEVITAPATAGN